MPLDKNIIKNGIQGLQDNPPTSVAAAAKGWAQFMFAYASSGLAGVTVPTFPGQPVLLENLFKSSMEGQVFLDKLGANLQTMWLAAVWNGAGFIPGVTAVAVGSILDTSMAAVAIAVQSGADGPTEISDAIDIWTRTIMVTLTTTTVPPVVSVVPVS